jgi:caffeoyl-CoA O-methyltransferase
MTARNFLLSEALDQYVRDHTEPADPLVRDLIAETATLPMAGMQIGPDEARLLALLVQISGARQLIEIGTFTGYSSLSMARALPDGGTLLCCDMSEEWTAIARRYWQRAGLQDRIELRLAHALDTLRALPSEPQFDLAFLDADKENYPAYLEELATRLRSGGLLLADNVLWSGAIVDDNDTRETTVGLRTFNDRITADARFENVLLSAFDGLMVARRR